MICVAVFETKDENREQLRQWLVRYSVQKDCELELLWFTDKDGASKLDKYNSQLQIALISLEDPSGEIIGKRLYEENPDCRICYYRSSACPLEPLLETRPIGFYLWADGMDAFMQTFDTIYREVVGARGTFRYETKNKMYLLPMRNILYVQSDLRYADICLCSGKRVRILAKLSQIEGAHSGTLVRVHKSYLVNPDHVLWLDRKTHTVYLDNHEEVPVSDAQYDYVYHWFQEKIKEK